MALHYIILAHQHPEQVLRLVDRLRYEDTHFYLHIDQGSDITPFIELIPEAEDLQYLRGANRFFTPWGDLGLVRSAVAGLRTIVEGGGQGHCILLSGQHYPIKSNAHIHSFLQKNATVNFVELFSMPTPRWAEGGMARLNNYKFRVSDRHGDFVTFPAVTDAAFYRSAALRQFAKLLLKGRQLPDGRILRKRRFPAYIRPYGGEHWWIFSVETAQDILNFINEHPDYLPYFEDTVLAEEICLQSLVAHLYGPESPRLQPCANFIKWTDRNSPHPETITLEAAPELAARPEHQLFARKFDPRIDEAILDRIDTDLLTPPVPKTLI
jgi:hypothetical protein